MYACVLGMVVSAPAVAQTPATIEVRVVHQQAPLAGATVIIVGASHLTNAAGIAIVAVASGPVEITVVKDGFVPVTTTAVAVAGSTLVVSIELQSKPAVEDVVTVSATRTGARLEDQPMRVEVLSRDEIEEKLLMTPGDIVMMLNEMGGLRVQATSPSLGAASIRIQGMRGRYTRFFSDGLPLFGEVGGLGLLQIPPMDLGQVEVIKGIASSLYGAGAMGGVVNLVSRRPTDEPERELLINQSTRGASDVVGWLSQQLTPQWGFTLLGGGHFQKETDVSGDDWADLPGYSRGIVRPRVFWDDGRGSSLFATVGFTAEERHGGTMPDMVLPQTGEPYREALSTRHFDAGIMAQRLVSQRYLLSARGAFSEQRHDHRFGENRERDTHNTAFGEATVRAQAGAFTLVGGFAIERNAYQPQDLPQFAYTFVVPGAFGQVDARVGDWLSLSGSARVDHHSEYGTFASPRVSALIRSGVWTSRLSVGTGFYGPSPLTEETEAAGLTRLVIPQPLQAEEGRSASIDLTRSAGPLSVTFTAFASRIQHPIRVDRSAGLVLTNLDEPTSNVGMELLGTLRHGSYSTTATYTYVRAREIVAGVSQDASLTPRHSAGVVAMWEREETGRVGLEVYYTGRQALEENPYSTTSRSYVVIGFLAERRFGRYRLFINGENLTGTRQTLWDPLLRPTRAPDGRWTVDAWAPLDGRNINGGVRMVF